MKMPLRDSVAELSVCSRSIDTQRPRIETGRRRPVTLTLALLILLGAPMLAGPAAELAESAEDIRPLLVGSPVPGVELRSIEGETIDLAKLIGMQPTVLIFYRGGW